MSLTVNFCGDSFCASKSKFSWCYLLSKKINAKIIGLGKGGSAHEHAIKSFNPNANITIFCWTEPNRLYHKKVTLNYREIEHRLKKSNPNRIYRAAKIYYKYIHDFEYAIDRQYRDLYWFDHEHLANYKGKIIHFYCHNEEKLDNILINICRIYFKVFPTTERIRYQFKNGISSPEILTYGKYIGENDEQTIFNHFTKEDNKKVAEYVYQLLQKS